MKFGSILKLLFLVCVFGTGFFLIQRKKAVEYPEIAIQKVVGGHSRSFENPRVLVAKNKVFRAITAQSKSTPPVTGEHVPKDLEVTESEVQQLSGLDKEPVQADPPENYSDSLVLREDFFKSVLSMDDFSVDKINHAEEELLTELVNIHEDIGDNPYEDVIKVDTRVTNAILDRYKLEVETHLTRSQVRQYLQFLKKNERASNFQFGNLFFDSSVLIRALSDKHGNAEIIRTM